MPLLFNIVIGDLFNVYHYSRHLLFAEDVNISHVITAVRESSLLQSDINCIHGPRTAHLMKLIMGTTRFVTSTGKTDLNTNIFINTVIYSFSD